MVDNTKAYAITTKILFTEQQVMISIMQVFAIKTSLIKPGDNIVSVLLHAIKKQSLRLENRDILAVSSKAVATAEGRIVKLTEISPSEKAQILAKKHSLEPEFAELVLQEADQVYGGVEKAVLTLKNHILTVNAGVDHKNAPKGCVVLWPLNPQKSAEGIRDKIRQHAGRMVGVIIVDSEVMPLRMGTRGFALAVAGFKPVRDVRSERDIFQKSILITRHAAADDLASTAHLLMGEAKEKVPAVLIRGAPVVFTDERVSSEEMKIAFDKCVYMSVLS